MHSLTFAPAFNVALLQFGGDVRGSDLIANARAFHADPRRTAGMDVIWDCREVYYLDVQLTEMLEIIGLRTRDKAGRDASVVAREIDETIAKLYQMIAEREGKRAFVCHTMDEAFDALGLNEDAKLALSLA